jgi:hypothetical protein
LERFERKPNVWVKAISDQICNSNPSARMKERKPNLTKRETRPKTKTVK